MKFTFGEIFENVRIIDMTVEGTCVAKHDGRVLFVSKTAPGDLVDVRVYGHTKNYLEAEPIHFHEKSTERTDPICRHFGVCGGCKWQHIGYASQLKYKEKMVRDALERIAKVPFEGFQPIEAAPEIFAYRNKLEYTCSNKRWFETKQEASDANVSTNAIGFHIPGRFDKVLDIEACHLQTDISNSIRNGLKAFAIDAGIPFFDVKQQSGMLRTLMIRTGKDEQLMVLVQFYQKDIETITSVMEFLKQNFPQITSLLYVINPKRNDTFHDLEVFTFAGRAFIEEQLGNRTFRVGPKSFFQTNSRQAYTLYNHALGLAGLQQTDVLYDLYTGTGTIALFAASHVKKVVGIEYVPSAIDDAHLNADLNGIKNASFFAGDIAKVLHRDFVAQNGTPDVVITDPPRAGMHADVIASLLAIRPRRIVYVSCNPATQARDLALLHPTYKVTAVQPVDMFPHTAHVENIVRLDLA